uniref:ZAD domain-containing protein n=1 Tax=Anopheles epiroticus TaxID=199890 RepID=A0A182PQ85_9DIPT
MERFSISILRQQVYNICRLCGVDNPDKIPILSEEEDVILVTDEDEPSLAKKIEECVGIKVHGMDQMPQKICTLCVDKVNDFYEYRLMCASTNLQTRTILNLPPVYPSISLVKTEPSSVTPEIPPDEDSVDSKPPLKRGPKTRNRKKQASGTDGEACSSEDADTKPFPDGPTEKRIKYEHACQYCNEAFGQNIELERHLVVKHTPLIHKFGCGSCMEYFDTASEYKDHNLWHKLSRTTFSCCRCNRKFVKIGTLNKHMAMNTCVKRPARGSYEVVLVPDMRCTLCDKVFKTRNLYEWHACFLRARANCPKCGKYFMKKNLLTRHYMLYCTGTLPLLEPAFLPKQEPGIPNGGSGLPDGVVPRKEGKRRGRPPATDKMKEEMLELPVPSPLPDLPDVKSETNSIVDGQCSTEETLRDNGMDMGERKRLKPTLVEETHKINTLLRSGASMDGNTDIATINSMLSSVSEAIASISKVRKKKRKRDRNDLSRQPMVVLSMVNVKQEALDDAAAFDAATDRADVPKGSNENEPKVPGNESCAAMECVETALNEYGSEMEDNVADSFADGHSASDTESIASNGVEVINLDTSDEEDASSTTRNTTRSQAMATLQTVAQTVQVKQEPVQSEGEMESDFEGYADPSDFVTVKQEPPEETDVSEPVRLNVEQEQTKNSSFSQYQALRIKIKKEKGLLSTSVVSDETAPVPPQEIESAASPYRQKHVRSSAKSKKPAKSPSKRNHGGVPVLQHLKETMDMPVRIKQEPMEPYEACQPQQSSNDNDSTLFDTMVQVKQEPQDEYNRPCGSASVHNEPTGPATDIVAFDGTCIKRERADTGTEYIEQQDQSRKAYDPLRLSGVRLSGGKNTSPSGGSKPNVMINPFALLKQKSAAPTANESDSHEVPPVERYGLPVISQVKSIDPKEHTSLPFGAVSEVPSKEAEEQHVEATVNSEDTGLTDPSSEPVADRVEPVTNVSGLKIASVASLQQGTTERSKDRVVLDKEYEHQAPVSIVESDNNTVQAPKRAEVSDLQDRQATVHAAKEVEATDKEGCTNEKENAQSSVDRGMKRRSSLDVPSALPEVESGSVPSDIGFKDAHLVECTNKRVNKEPPAYNCGVETQSTAPTLSLSDKDFSGGALSTDKVPEPTEECAKDDTGNCGGETQSPTSDSSLDEDLSEDVPSSDKVREHVEECANDNKKNCGVETQSSAPDSSRLDEDLSEDVPFTDNVQEPAEECANVATRNCGVETQSPAPAFPVFKSLSSADKVTAKERDFKANTTQPILHCQMETPSSDSSVLTENSSEDAPSHDQHRAHIEEHANEAANINSTHDSPLLVETQSLPPPTSSLPLVDEVPK